MRILLINPPDQYTIREWTCDGYEEFIEVKDFGRYPPLGLLYVISYLDEHTEGHELSLIDCVAEELTHEALRPRLEALRPDIVGITSFTLSLIDCCEVARAVRRIVPDAHICLGGHHPIGFPFEAAQLPEFDSIVVGEGEIAFTELVGRIERGEPFTDIKGVYTKESIEVYRESPVTDRRLLHSVTVPAAYVEDLDSLPIPNRKWIQHIRYFNPIGRGRNMATIISSRGCPFQCTYCDVPFKRYRKVAASRVLDEVEHCLSLGYNEFHFYDDLFNITPARLIEFCDEVERRGVKFSWDFRGRVNGVDRESLVRAKRAGCWMISFGVETGTDEGLKKIKKATTTAKVREAFDLCRELGIVTVADFMIGFPFERTKADIRRSIDYLLELDPDYTLLAILMLLPGTELYRDGVEHGQVDPQKWIEFSLNPTPEMNFKVDYWTEHLSVEELIEMRKEAYRRFYMRPKYMIRTALAVRSVHELERRARGLFTLLKKGILRRSVVKRADRAAARRANLAG